MIKKIRDRDDRRIVWVRPTKKGEKFIRDASKPTTELVKKLFSTLSDKEIKSGIVFINKLMEKFELNSNINKFDTKTLEDFINELCGY